MALTRTAFALLLDIDQRCRVLAAGLPLQATRQQGWSGIGFRLASGAYVAPMGEVAEILSEPRCAAVPGVKPWVRGVTSLRGRLLPVIDLCQFIGLESPVLHKPRRVLVIEHQDVLTGLLVDEVLGMQHFDDAELRLDPVKNAPPGIERYLSGQFEGVQPWRVFSPRALMQAPDLRDIAFQ